MKELLDTRVMHASDPTDVRLLQRIAARDTGALAELYDRHSRLLFGLILRVPSPCPAPGPAAARDTNLKRDASDTASSTYWSV